MTVEAGLAKHRLDAEPGIDTEVVDGIEAGRRVVREVETTCTQPNSR